MVIILAWHLPSAQPKARWTRPVASSGNGQQSAPSERRQALVQIAAELFAERGFKATTVREIGDAAGVLSGSLYHHFDSKETIVDEILSNYLDSLTDSYRQILAENADPAITLADLIRSAFLSMGPHRAAITVLQNERNYLAQLPRFAYLAKTERQIEQMWTAVLEQGVASGAFRSDRRPEDRLPVPAGFVVGGGALVQAGWPDDGSAVGRPVPQSCHGRPQCPPVEVPRGHPGRAAGADPTPGCARPPEHPARLRPLGWLPGCDAPGPRGVEHHPSDH